MNLGQLGTNYLYSQDGVARKSKEVEEMASVFSAMAYQNVNNTGVAPQEKTMDATKVDSMQEYERFQYQDNSIEEQSDVTLSDTSEPVEELEQFSHDVTEVIANELGVSKEQVVAILEEMGMTSFDLLNPQNLADVVMQLQGITDKAQLLLNADFQNLMTQIGQMGNTLMKDLNLNVSQMNELVAKMELLEKPILQEEMDNASGNEQIAEPSFEVENTLANEQNVANDAISEPEIVVEDKTQMEATVSNEMDESSENSIEDAELLVSDEAADDLGMQDMESQQDAEVPLEDGVLKNTKLDTFSDMTKENNHHSFSRERNLGQQSTDSLVLQSNFNVEIQDVFSVPTETGSYVSVNALDMIQQVAENVKILIANNASSMEMQLNPENLGKIYLNVSVEEGVVNAQLAVQNETVKEALEVQLATLRENLNQAGIKVDAVEVTVASHEFEKNLEQDGRREQEEANQQTNSTRRNINLESLDDLTGLMSEEETLVAKMMRDNGNSVDFTA